MGRNKIKIERITNERTRLATFNKRKNGLVKKAMELAILCGCEVALIVIGNNKLTQYSSSDMDQLLLRYTDGGFDEPQSDPLSSEDYPKLFGKRNKGNKESPTKKPRVESPVPHEGAHAVVAPALKSPSAAHQSPDGRASPALPASAPVVPLVARGGSSPSLGGKPLPSPPPAGAARLSSAPQQQLAPYLATVPYVGYSTSARTPQFLSQSVSRSPAAPSHCSVPSTAPSAPGRASPSHRGSFASTGSTSPTFEGISKPQSPHSSNPPTPPGSGGQYAEEMRRASGSGRFFQEQQFSQKLNKKNLSLAIPDASASGNFPGSSSASHSRHTAYTPGFTGLNVPSAVMPFMTSETDMQHSAVLPSPSAFFGADTPGSHSEPGHFLPPSSAAWGWLASPRHTDLPQERFLSRDLNLALQDGTLHHQLNLGKSVYSVGEKRKASDILKV